MAFSEVEVSQLASVVRNAAESIDAHVVMEIVGDYRRDLPFCSSVSILLTSPYGVIGFLGKLVEMLRSWRFLVPVSQPSSSQHDPPESSVWNGPTDVVLSNIPPDELKSELLPEDHFHGLCRFKPDSSLPLRSVELTACLPHNWPFALLYRTGPRLFYEKLQAYALDFDISITPDGLEHLEGHPTRTIDSEKGIFLELKLPYLPPPHRFDSVIFPARKLQSHLASVELDIDPS
ncbi:MAG: hypothetical protein Q8P67_06745 [archaeon]|nr:hypothetical protein [archaeon]